MTYAIPVPDKNGITTRIFGHFGSAPVFAIFSEETGFIQYIENGNQHHEHGQCQPVDELTQNHVKGVICSGMGMRAVQKLNELGIQVYKVNPGLTVQGVLEMIGNKVLAEIKVEEVCREHDCH